MVRPCQSETSPLQWPSTGAVPTVVTCKAYFPLGGKLLSQKSSFVCKYDSARKLNGFLLLSDVAFPQANQIAGKGRCERNIPPNGNQA